MVCFILVGSIFSSSSPTHGVLRRKVAPGAAVLIMSNFVTYEVLPHAM